MGLSGQSTNDVNRDLVKNKQKHQVNSLRGGKNFQEQGKHFGVKMLLRKKEKENYMTKPHVRLISHLNT